MSLYWKSDRNNSGKISKVKVFLCKILTENFSIFIVFFFDICSCYVWQPPRFPSRTEHRTHFGTSSQWWQRWCTMMHSWDHQAFLVFQHPTQHSWLVSRSPNTSTPQTTEYYSSAFNIFQGFCSIYQTSISRERLHAFLLTIHWLIFSTKLLLLAVCESSSASIKAVRGVLRTSSAGPERTLMKMVAMLWFFLLASYERSH